MKIEKENKLSEHYVPKFVLKNFTFDNNQIWVFDKQTDKKFKTNIDNIASENKFYDFNFKNVVLTLEPSLSTFESKVAKIITEIVTKKTLFFLKKEDKIILSYFFALQFVRTKQFRLMFKNGLESLKKAFIQKDCEIWGRFSRSHFSI